MGIALDFDTEMKEASESSDKEKTYELPDGNIITRQRALPVPGGALSAELHWQGGFWHPRYDLPVDHEVRRRYPQGPLRQRCAFWRHDDVHGRRREDDQGVDGPRAFNDEDQGHRPP